MLAGAIPLEPTTKRAARNAGSARRSARVATVQFVQLSRLGRREHHQLRAASLVAAQYEVLGLDTLRGSPEPCPIQHPAQFPHVPGPGISGETIEGIGGHDFRSEFPLNSLEERDAQRRNVALALP